jgi:hypothetical protein
MSALLETTVQIDSPDYPCESCGREFDPPRPRTGPGFRGRLTILRTAFGHTIRHRTGLRSTYRSIRPRMIARWNEEAFQGFVDGFQMCGECRGFICPKCWDGKRRVCSSCTRAARDAGARARKAAARGRTPVKAGSPGTVRLASVPLAVADPGTERKHRGRPTFGLGPLLRPGRARTVTSVVLMFFSLALGALEMTYFVVRPHV